MSASKFCCIDDKYLFTFQDETQLCIPKEFIEKYPELPFQDVIKHSEKYDDGSYYIDIPYYPMNKVIQFLMEDNVDIFSLNLKDSYDIYATFVKYSVTIDKEIQSGLLYHVNELFYQYLKENNYEVFVCYFRTIKECMPMELFNFEKKEISFNGLITPAQKDELLYYSLLIKMMNITKVEIIYDYSSNIPSEYICPAYIKNIFPSLEELTIIVTTHYKRTELLLNPNSDNYIMEYNRLFNEYDYEIKNPKNYEYYTKSDMNEYNKISSLDLNKIYYSDILIDSYYEKREKNELPKLYKYIVNEAIYTNDYSNVEISETKDKYTLRDEVSIKYDDKTNDKTFFINVVSSEYGIAQLLLLPSYLYCDFQYDSMVFVKLFEKGLFDSSTVLNIVEVQKVTKQIDENLFNKVMTTHVFPNVTEIIYNDYDDESFQLSLIERECFPELHIINYNIKINIATDNFKSLFPVNVISMIDTIRIRYVNTNQKEILVPRLDDLAYTHSIHIDIIDIDIDDLNYFPHLNELLERNLISFDKFSIKSFHSENIKILDSIGNYKQNIDSLNITLKIDKNMNIECLEWMSTLFKNNKFNTIHKLTIDSLRNTEDLSFEYFSTHEDILEKLIPKASIVDINYRYMSFKSQLIPKGCFHNTTQLVIRINDILDDNFFKLYTMDNFPQLKTIRFYKKGDEEGNIEWYSSFIKLFCTYMSNNNFPSSSIVSLGEYEHSYYYDYVYYPNTSILRCKYDTNSYIDTIIVTDNKVMNKYEIETLFEYIYDEEQLSKLINFITTGKIPKLEELVFDIDYSLSVKIDIYEKQLNDWSFKQKHYVRYKFN
ncbi:hypothetical protein WA158_000709 [Blastocystis sp. Blastoise]